MEETVRYTYRLRPGVQAERALLDEWHRCRFLWNEAVHQERSGQKPTRARLGKLLTDARRNSAWLREGWQNAQATILCNYAAELDRSFKVKGRRKPVVKRRKAALPSLEASDAGSIVTISSVSGREIDFAAGPYGTFKGAIIHYTQGLAHQLAGRVRANSVSPGNTYFPGGVWESIEENDPDLFAHALGLNPTGRMASPDEIAALVAQSQKRSAVFDALTNPTEVTVAVA